jgi:serine phosphatase RsbU (regulator of sigma subunit)
MNTSNNSEKSPENAAKRRFDSFLGYSASFALFILLPIMIAAVLGANAIALEQQRAFDDARNSLETRLTQFACDVDTDTFLTRVARGAWLSLANHKLDSPQIKNYIGKLENFIPTDFDLYLFDDDGRLITPSEVKLRSRYVGSKLWQLIKASPIDQSVLFKRIRKPVKSFLGGEFKVAQLLEKKDGLLPIIVRHQSGYIYWQDKGDRSSAGMMLIFWQKPALEFRVKEMVARNAGGFYKGFVRREDDKIIDIGFEETSAPRGEQVHSRLALLKQPFFLDNNEIWSGRKIDGSWVYVAAKFAVNWYERLHFMLVLLLGMILLLAVVLLIKAKNAENLRLSIRLKLTVLFLTAVFVPIMGFAFLGYQYLADREETLLASVANQSRRSLFALDESLRNVGAAYEKELKDLLPVFTNSDKQYISSRLEDKLQSNELVTVEVRDINAEVKFSQVNELFFEGMKDVSEAFSRFCIDTALGTSLADGVDPILSMIIKAPEGGMFFLFDRPGEIHPLEFGPAPLLIFWQIIENASAEKRYVFVVQSAAILIKKLVRKRMKETYLAQRGQPQITVARHNTSGEWFPASLVRSREMKKFAERLLFSDKPIDSHVEMNGESYFVTGQKGKYASDYCFFNFYPRALIDKDLKQIRKMILAGMLAFIIVAVLTGNILSSTFLEPISRLAQGVDAIKNRESDFRIETDQHDEFGDLSISFNQMIEDLKEMQLARDVQESLLPSDFPQIEGYQLSFANRMASDVGGDYFDLHRLDENRVCLLIGDVTGHGVSSALVMAMAKAIVYQGLKENQSLVELFADLNLAVFTYFKIPPARKMITLFAAILDEKTGEISYVNAGHNFPALVKSSGDIQNLSAVHLPIGASSRLRGLEVNKCRLEKGDSLILYTDGLIEATSLNNQMYGYDRFKEELCCYRDCSASEILEKLLNEYDRFLAGAEADDDVTIIVLKKVV